MMRKRLIKMLLLAVILSFVCTAGVFADTKGIDVIINGQKIAGAGAVIDGQVMVPLETLARAMNGTFEWTPESGTATVTLPGQGKGADSNLNNCYSIKVNKITKGLTILTLSGEVTNTSNHQLTTLAVSGKLLDTYGRELTRSHTTNLNPTELAPGETGYFEVVFLDYYKLNDNELRYAIYVTYGERN